MDLREIIKWFIPCFHILLKILSKKDFRLTFLCIFLFFNLCPSFGANVRQVGLGEKSFVNAKNVDNLLNISSNVTKINQSEVVNERNADSTSLEDISVGRTFGRPFMKKIMTAFIPLVFQIGAASTWAVVAALVGVKTLFVTLVILKLLLVAGAAKAGALIASKGHQPQTAHGWAPPQKEIHLHIHNSGHHATHEEHITPSTWSRNEIQPENDINMVLNPYAHYAGASGPQTISTPFGNYVKIS